MEIDERELIDGREQYGRYYEDFNVDDVYKHWPGHTITEGEHALFCALTRNDHPVHSDQVYAASAHHGRVLVVGTFVFSLAVGMTVRDISGKAIANLEYESVTHDAPVFIGDTLYAETVVVDKKPTSKAGIVIVETRAVKKVESNPGWYVSVVVLTLRRKILVPRREQ